MEVTLAKTAGFCFGVKRAVDTVYRELEKAPGVQIYTYGPIIHNEEVIKDMEQKGVIVLRTEKELENLEEGIVIIRSHGVPKRIYEKMEERGLICVDATCPFVKKIHKIVEHQISDNVQTIIIGDENHPEVQGIKGWAGKDAIVISEANEVKALKVPKGKKVHIVAQTTFNYNKFEDLVEIISEKGYDIIVLNTICNATKERQMEALSIARESDAMIVIGDKHSSNTQKLFEICDNACENTYYIQTIDDLDLNQLEFIAKVGITAGASTPKNIIEEVQNNVRINF